MFEEKDLQAGIDPEIDELTEMEVEYLNSLGE